MIYEYKNEAGEIEEHNMKLADKADFEASHPELTQVLGAMNIGYTYNRKKPDQGFRDILRESKAHNKNSTIDIP